MNSNTKLAESYNTTDYWRTPARNFRTSARLHLQHALWQNTVGFLLEEHVKQALPTESSGRLKVADLACGNGVWLTDLSRELADKGILAHLDGFDINDILFPAPAFLPPSVSFQKLDVLAKPLPQDLIGAYDVVHVRAFTSLIVHADTTPLLSTVLAMLKPGGWLQWEEINPDLLIEPATPGLEKSACEALKRSLRASGEALGLRFDYLDELDQHLIKHGFEEVHMIKTTKRKQDYKAWTDDFLMVWEECTFYWPSKVTAPQAPLTREFWVENLVKAVDETEKGVALHGGIITTSVGRKPI